MEEANDCTISTLIEILGWQGGTKHQVIAEVGRLKKENEKIKILLQEVLDDTEPHQNGEPSDGLGHCIGVDLWGRIYSALYGCKRTSGANVLSVKENQNAMD